MAKWKRISDTKHVAVDVPPGEGSLAVVKMFDGTWALTGFVPTPARDGVVGHTTYKHKTAGNARKAGDALLDVGIERPPGDITTPADYELREQSLLDELSSLTDDAYFQVTAETLNQIDFYVSEREDDITARNWVNEAIHLYMSVEKIKRETGAGPEGSIVIGVTDEKLTELPGKTVNPTEPPTAKKITH